MVRKGIHPLVRTMTVVLRNGASIQVNTTMNRTAPYMLQVDTTTHPLWTGEKAGLSVEDERLMRVVGRFNEFVGDAAAEEEPPQPQPDKRR